jgi:hypothetical protein
VGLPYEVHDDDFSITNFDLRYVAAYQDVTTIKYPAVTIKCHVYFICHSSFMQNFNPIDSNK